MDFACLEPKLVVELDGEPHMTRRRRDRQRTEELRKRGFVVIRFWNSQVSADIESVLRTILDKLHEGRDGA
ncbi:MAG: hypothetical protein BMS9Abin10_0856 [Gammaproteobacteria bacterium]|nr:MAG: hypothetical protein BMS9Abin10_0856 [Gammaproteobacteria bacterium]